MDARIGLEQRVDPLLPNHEASVSRQSRIRERSHRPPRVICMNLESETAQPVVQTPTRFRSCRERHRGTWNSAPCSAQSEALAGSLGPALDTDQPGASPHCVCLGSCGSSTAFQPSDSRSEPYVFTCSVGCHRLLSATSLPGLARRESPASTSLLHSRFVSG